MRSVITRRVLVAILAALALGIGVPIASQAVQLAVAHAELARLNDEFDTDATFDQDTLSPGNQAKSLDLIRRVHEANLEAKRSKRLASGSPVLARSP